MIEPWALAAAAAVCAAGALVQSTIGFGVALVAVPFLAMIEPDLLPGPFLLASLLLALLMVARDRHALERAALRIPALGLALGTAVGAAALLVVEQDDLPELFAFLILLAVGASACGLRVRIGPASLFAAGVIGGVMGTMGGVHGPAMALLYQAEAGERVRATLGAFFIAGYVVSLLGLGLVGLFGPREVALGLALCPGIVLGWLTAPLAIRRLDPERLRPIILTVSALAALVLLLTG